MSEIRNQAGQEGLKDEKKTQPTRRDAIKMAGRVMATVAGLAISGTETAKSVARGIIGSNQAETEKKLKHTTEKIIHEQGEKGVYDAERQKLNGAIQYCNMRMQQLSEFTTRCFDLANETSVDLQINRLESLNQEFSDFFNQGKAEDQEYSQFFTNPVRERHKSYATGAEQSGQGTREAMTRFDYAYDRFEAYQSENQWVRNLLNNNLESAKKEKQEKH